MCVAPDAHLSPDPIVRQQSDSRFYRQCPTVFRQFPTEYSDSKSMVMGVCTVGTGSDSPTVARQFRQQHKSAHISFGLHFEASKSPLQPLQSNQHPLDYIFCKFQDLRSLWSSPTSVGQCPTASDSFDSSEYSSTAQVGHFAVWPVYDLSFHFECK